MGKARKLSPHDLSGLLRTYSMKAASKQSKEELEELVRDLRDELDLRRVRFRDAGEDEFED